MGDLTNKGGNPPANQGLKSHAGLSDEDYGIRPLRVKLGQPSSEKDTEGKFCFYTGKDKGEEVDELSVVPILAKKTRAFYNKKDKLNPIRCASDNYDVPSERIKNPVSSSCANCPAAQWGMDVAGKPPLAAETGNALAERPLCKDTYNVLFVDTKSDVPFFMGFDGTSIKRVRDQLFTAFRMRGLEFFQACLKVVSHKVGTYYSPSFQSIKKLEDYSKYERIFDLFASGGADKALHDEFSSDVEDNGEEIPF